MSNILIASTQYPFHGGAATLAYDFHNYLQNNNINSNCCFFLNSREEIQINNNKQLLNPNKYDNVFKTSSKNFDKEILNNIDCVLAINYGIVPIIKNFYKKKIIYIVTGSPELTLGKECPCSKQISFKKFINDEQYDLNDIINTNNNLMNLDSIQNSDFTVINSPNTRKIYERIFPDYTHKFKNLYSLEILIYYQKYNLVNDLVNDDLVNDDLVNNDLVNNDLVNNDDNYKEYDLIAVSSSWSRIVKNKKLTFDIFNKYSNVKKIIIGNNIDSDPNYKFSNIENTTVIQSLPNDLILNYLSKSKILLIPSYFESAGIIILEALRSKCKIITSENIGLSYILPEEYLCKDIYDLDEWISNIDKINYTNQVNYKIPNYENIDIISDIFELTSKNYEISSTVKVLEQDK